MRLAVSHSNGLTQLLLRLPGVARVDEEGLATLVVTWDDTVTDVGAACEELARTVVVGGFGLRELYH